jgi:hypothetical protein
MEQYCSPCFCLHREKLNFFDSINGADGIKYMEWYLNYVIGPAVELDAEE